MRPRSDLLRWTRMRGEDGNALVEFTYLAVLLMVPLVYVLTAAFQVQRAAFGVTEAARQAGRAYATADDPASGTARARTAARLAMKDQGLSCSTCLTGPSGDLAPDSRVTVTVRYNVELPVLGVFFGGATGPSIPVSSTHVEVVDRFRQTGAVVSFPAAP